MEYVSTTVQCTHHTMSRHFASSCVIQSTFHGTCGLKYSGCVISNPQSHITPITRTVEI